MTIRKEIEPLIRINLNLFRADYDRLKEMYPNNYSTYLRKLLRNHLNKITEQADAAAAELDINLEI